jgi:K+-sensing histidine kinase KdpD
MRLHGATMLAVVVATIIRLLLDPWLDRTQIFSWYYAAVVVSAWFGGWRCSLLASIGGYAAADWFFIEPHYSLVVSFYGLDDWLALASYIGVCTAIGTCTEAMRRQAPTLVFRLDMDDSLELLDVASAVRIHGITSQELPAYLEGLNASQNVYRLAVHFARRDMSPRELATRLESLVKGSGPVGAFSSLSV